MKLPDVISDRCAAPINCSLATTMCAMEYVPKIKNGRAFVQVNGILLFLKVLSISQKKSDTTIIFIHECVGEITHRSIFCITETLLLNKSGSEM